MNIYPIDFRLDFRLQQRSFFYNIPESSFGWIGSINDNEICLSHTETCRELFTFYFIRDDGKGYKKLELKNHEFVFFHSSANGSQIMKFIREFELRLGLINYTQFHGITNVSNASVVFPSAWWFENQLRIQLFSILLRCGQYYTGDFDKAILTCGYAARTKKAIYKFLEGFTKWAGTESNGSDVSIDFRLNQLDWKHGWVHYFDNDQNLDLLIK